MTATVVRAAACLALLLAVGGCVGEPPVSDPSGVDGLQIPTPSPDPDDFVERVDNPWFPLEPGTVWTYEESQGDEAPSTVVVTVTDETRVVAGVRTTVVHDVVTDADGAVVEDTHDWFAQDRDGNVWYFGEQTTTYDDGAADTSGSWEAGSDGAEAGLVMPATPRLGDGFQQEYLAGVAEGRATVLSLTEVRTVFAGAFTDLLETQDTTPLEPGVIVRAYYARGVGLVYRETVGGGEGHRELLHVSRPEE
ncbi:hypothetical protein [Nocardioides sp.]|uniref:hypothetical protein n=1 Tax=Nocardioides sp. TaxID=35761 RepID=UPI0035670876